MVYIQKTEEFLKKTFDESKYFLTHESEKNYRLEHSYRVANIAEKLHKKKGWMWKGL